MEFNNNQAIYLQIAEHFIENILQKKWPAGEKIPSIRDMAVEFEVNPNTAMRTYNFLQEKEIIFNKRGLGYFVCDDGFEKTLQLKKTQFLEGDLPSFFKTMELLRISMDDLKKYHIEYIKNA
jgi:GntR family transcriptional regulator